MPRPRLPSRLLPHPVAFALRLAIAGTCVASAALPAPAFAQAAATVRSFDIPAGPLAATLNRIGEASGLLLTFDPALVRGRAAPAVSGRLTVQQALDRALAGSGLVAAADGASTVIRLAPGTPALPATRDVTLPTVTVTADALRETATGPFTGYIARRSATGTKTDTAIVETPQSISVVGAEEIEARRSSDLMEALGYVAGVARLEGADRTSDGFVIRGFQAFSSLGSLYRDGTKYSVNGYDGQQEPYGLERIEVLKGASSVLYGTAAPGGIVNTVSKRPTADTLRELNVEVGTDARKQLSGDFAGALDAEKNWTYRLTGLVRDSDTFVDHIRDDRAYFAPALRWQPDARTSLTLLAEYQHDRTGYIYGLPAEATVLPNPNGRVPRNRFIGEPGYDKYDLQRFSAGYLFEHTFDAGHVLRHSARYFAADLDFPSVWIWGLDTDGRTTISRGAQDRQDRSRAIVADTSMLFKWKTGEVAHDVVAGFDVTSEKFRTARWDRDAAPLDLYDPVYGVPFGPAVPSANSWQTSSRRIGVYLQDQMKIADRWVVLLGGRHDTVRYDQRAVFSDAISADGEKTSAFTGRAGLVYLAPSGVAPYASFSQSYEPQSGNDRTGARFEPTRGEQWELGVRYQPTGGDTLLSAALYDLVRTNVLVTDPVDPTFSAALGRVRSRGLELEARTRIDANTNIVAAYAYTDSRTIESSPLTPAAAGKRSGAVPYNQFSAWADHGFGAFGLPGLRIGAGVRFVGSTNGIWIDAGPKAFTLVDAMVSYATGPWRFALNVTNLADRNYIASCTYDCFYGEPRRVKATVTHRW